MVSHTYTSSLLPCLRFFISERVIRNTGNYTGPQFRDDLLQSSILFPYSTMTILKRAFCWNLLWIGEAQSGIYSNHSHLTIKITASQ